VLYVSYTDGAGPYDGTAGYLQKYNLTDKSWVDISPITDAFGYGGLTIDLQRPGTLMVATLNQWWPDANIWRSTDSGKTWRGIWEWAPWPQKMFFDYDVSSAPWLYDSNSGEEFRKLVGWMIESLTIDPFDSNHFLYGTGSCKDYEVIERRNLGREREVEIYSSRLCRDRYSMNAMVLLPYPPLFSFAGFRPLYPSILNSKLPFWSS